MPDTSLAATARQVVADRPNDAELIRVLQNSLYPGARPESIRLVLAWCKSTGRDPMKKPIHIVPMYVKDAVTGRGDYRDVLMPGIGTYRSDAAVTGQYAGKSEPEFGPTITQNFDGMEVSFPEWCRVTVHRLVGGQPRAFTAREFWVENYATGKEKKGVNDMWKKRAFGQLAKVAEAQALRMAFPDETGNTNTSEEMEGKSFEGVTIEQEPAAPKAAASVAAPAARAKPAPAIEADPLPPLYEPDAPYAARLDDLCDRLAAEKDGQKWTLILTGGLDAAESADEVAAIQGLPDVHTAMQKAPARNKADMQVAFATAFRRVMPTEAEAAGMET